MILHRTLFARSIFAQNDLETLFRPTLHPPISLLRCWRACLKQIGLGIRSTIVFFSKCLETRDPPLRSCFFGHYSYPTAAISRAEHASPTLLTHLLVHVSPLCTLCNVD